MLGYVGRLGMTALLMAHLSFCGACSRRWAFAHPGSLISKATTPTGASDPFFAHRPPDLAQSPVRLPRTQDQPSRTTILASHEAEYVAGTPSDSTRSGELQLAAGYLPGDSRVISADGAWPTPLSESIIEQSRRQAHGIRPRVCRRLREAKYKVLADYRDYYSWPNMRDLLLGVSMGSIFANTSMDQDIRDWYQEDVRDSGTDDFASFWKVFGDGRIFISSFAAMAIAEGLIDIEEGEPGYHVGVFSDRVTRAYLVGAPPMLFMQVCLGASRPGEKTYQSRWRPFEDNNGVSGHGFVGAVPFLTAGKMIEQDHPYMAGCLYFCSALPAWSRVNDDDHYFSQACLGWWMAYLACRTVNDTEDEYRHLTFTPLAMNDTVGIGAVYQR